MRYYCQMLAAFLGAVLVANGLCYFYYSPSVQTDNPEGYTECKNEPSHHNPHGTEGYGIAVIDDNGFSNADLFSYQEAEILCVGSSQTEAQHVNWDENYVYLLNEQCKGRKVYNLGVSAQAFANSLYRIPALKTNFPACQAIVFEINNMPSEKDLLQMKGYMEKNEIPVRDLSWKRGNLALQILGKIPLCRLLWSQYDHNRKGKIAKGKEEMVNIGVSYYELANEVLKLAKRQAGDTPIILFNLSKVKIERDGNVVIQPDYGEKAALRAACQVQGITFVDMGQPFLEHYSKERVLPYGFANSKVAVGHLNAHGHRIVAETLYDVFKKDGLCQ